MKELSLDGITPVEPPETLGPAPLLQWLPVDALLIDPSFQRDMALRGKRNVRQIAANFSWTHFAPLMVSPIAGGRYSIIDGQHRATAALLLGIEQVPCAVVIADAQTQAAAFHAVNAKTTKLHTVQIFHARLAARDPRALAAASVCSEASVTIIRSPAGGWRNDPAKTMAVEAIETVARRHRQIAVTTLQLIRHCNETGHYCRNHLRSVVIYAVFAVLHDHQDWCQDLDVLSERFRILDLDSLWASATIANAQIRGTTVCDQLQACLIEELSPHFSRKAIGSKSRALTV